MSDYEAYRVKIAELPLNGTWSAVFHNRETDEAVGNITIAAPTKAAATQWAMGYCTAFYRMGAQVQFDVARGS